MPAIVIEQLEKRYRGSPGPAVHDLCLTIEEGELLGLLGPNGAGKTTTLSILCGLLRSTRGTVRIRGEDVGRRSCRLRQVMGFVPQDIALYPTLTARENLTFFAHAYGLWGKAARRRVDACLELVGLLSSADRRVATYSGGMKRRANLVAGLIHEPSILVLDEPTVGIDAQSRNVIMENLRSLNAAGTTMIYATHYMEEAQQLCSRVAVIDGGKILKEGVPAQLVKESADCANLAELFLELTGRSLRDQ